MRYAYVSNNSSTLHYDNDGLKLKQSYDVIGRNKERN